MSSAWPAWVAIALTVAAYLGRDLIRRGKIDAVLEQLTDLIGDHEDRLRELEQRRARKQPGAHRSGPRHGP